MSQPNLWGFDPSEVGGKVGRSHPETSRKAAKQVKSGTQKAQLILSLDVDYLHGGKTAYELSASIFTSDGRTISPNQTATRLGELREQGLVSYAFDQIGRPVERETTPGNTGIVHVLTLGGRQVATDLKLERNNA
tara:strand:- start:1659 stop:2063 length:405 start_codon:yes stop_codon:yes gene_type:complete